MFGSDLDALYFISAEWIYKKFLRAEVMRMSKLVSKIVKFYLRTHERRNWIFKWRKPIKRHISPLPRIWNVLISHCSRTELFILHIYTLYCLLSIIYSIWLNYYIMISLPAKAFNFCVYAICHLWGIAMAGQPKHFNFNSTASAEQNPGFERKVWEKLPS